MHEVVTPETEMHDVQIFKNNSELGITVAGYVCDKEEISGIFVKDISIGSAADLTGNIKINDRIVKVNGKSLTTLTNQEAIKLLKNSGPIVLISLERYPQSAKSYDIQSDTIYSPVSAECFISALSNDVVDPKFEEKMHLSLLTEVSEEQEKQSKMNSLTEEENDNNPMPFSTNIKEYTIQTDLDKNTIKEIPLDVPSNTLNDNNKPPTQELQIATKMADSSVNSDSSCIYFSDDTERDEYETCMDDSFSEENFNTKLDKSPSFEDTQSDVCNYNFVNNYVDTVSSEPCLNMRDKLQSWKSKDANLKSFDSDLTETDEFFLVQCINENVAQKPVAYKCIKLEEYYNDYEDCIESYKESFRKLILETEEDLSMESKYLEDACGRVAQDECLPSKSSSAPHLLESYQEECYGCPKDFRKPSLPGFLNNVRNSEEEAEEEEEEMTVTAKQQNFDGSSENVLKKHWGVNKRIEVYREPNGSVGISIVCGKVDLHNLETSFGTISGIFIKSVVPNSAAGRTGQFQTGDRIIKVGDIDLTNATQEEALNAIRSSTDPISFIVQPILPLNDLCVSEKDSIEPEVDKILDKEVLAEERATENEIDVGQEKQEDEDESEKLKVEEKPQEPQPLLAEPQPPLPQPQPPSIKYDDEEDEEDDYDDEEEDQRNFREELYQNWESRSIVQVPEI